MINWKDNGELAHQILKNFPAMFPLLIVLSIIAIGLYIFGKLRERKQVVGKIDE